MVLKDFSENKGYSLNAFQISERTNIDVCTTYRCISALVVSGYIRLSFFCSSEHSVPRAADYYEVTEKGLSFIREEKTFCRTWQLPIRARPSWQWRFPYLRFYRS